MPDTPITTDCAECGLPSFAAQEARNQRVVLDFLLEQHPAQLTIPEVAQALWTAPGSSDRLIYPRKNGVGLLESGDLGCVV